MKTGRIISAGIVGGIVVFAWSALAHMVLPIGEMGVKSLPNEAPVTTAMKANIPDDGFYFIPGMSKKPTDAEKKEWEAKYKAGPHGILVFHPGGEEMNMGKMMGVEFGADVLAALIGAAILASMAGGMGCRLMVGLGLGLFSWLNLDVSYWNWYGFPLELIEGSLIEQAVGWMAAAVVMGWIVGKCTKCAPAAA
jgi:hypothetical protein